MAKFYLGLLPNSTNGSYVLSEQLHHQTSCKISNISGHWYRSIYVIYVCRILRFQGL